MQRRRFLQQSSLASLAGLAFSELNAMPTGNPAPDNNTAFTMDYAFHDGMFAAHAGKSFLDQIRFGYDQGFRSIEDNGLMGRSVQEQEQIGSLLAKLGMRMGVFVITSDSWHWKTSLATGKQEWKDRMKKDCQTAVEVAKRVNARWMTVVPGNYERSLPIGIQTGNVIDALKMGADILAPHGLTMVLEPLSDNADLFLRHSDQTYEICRAVGSPACKILYDIYHMQRNEGNLMANIDKCWEEIAYIQIGDNPGRKEPGTGEINYRNVFRHLYRKGYKGILGMEHGVAGQGKEGELALIKAYREADAFEK
ncbi:MAG: TIM barrel protein [Chitinophagaceae bacterium]|nr:TIM barrel protein [Chitinophagaceae bacterium]